MEYEYETDYPGEAIDIWIERLAAPAIYPPGVRYASNRQVFPSNHALDSAPSSHRHRYRRG
jgi:hypothetical protein